MVLDFRVSDFLGLSIMGLRLRAAGSRNLCSGLLMGSDRAQVATWLASGLIRRGLTPAESDWLKPQLEPSLDMLQPTIASKRGARVLPGLF